MRKTAEYHALRLPSDIDFRALWTFKSLDEDGELQVFFEGLLGLCNSTAVLRGRVRQSTVQCMIDREGKGRDGKFSGEMK
jgi:hypothetical protein